MRKNKELIQSIPIRIMTGVILGAVIAFFICLGILFVAAMGISQGVLEEGLQYQITLFACLVSVLVGGCVSFKYFKSVLMGFGTGIVFYLFLLTIGVLFYEVRPLDHGGIGILCSALVGGALAGAVHVRKPKKKRR